MEKAEARRILKRLQAITTNRGDAEVPQVLEEIREVLDDAPREKSAERKKTGGRDRQQRAGRNRGKR